MISDDGDLTCKDGKIAYHIAMTMVTTCQIDWIVIVSIAKNRNDNNNNNTSTKDDDDNDCWCFDGWLMMIMVIVVMSYTSHNSIRTPPNTNAWTPKKMVVWVHVFLRLFQAEIPDPSTDHGHDKVCR